MNEAQAEWMNKSLIWQAEKMREPCVEPLKKCQDDNVLAFLGETVRYRRCGAFFKKGVAKQF